MANTTSDKLDFATASASEMEQAIKAMQNQPAEIVEPEPKEVVEVKPEPLPEPEVKEVVEEKQYDYKKGYENLRSWMTKFSQEISELKKGVTAPKREEPVQPTVTQQQWAEAYEVDPVGTTKLLAQYEADQKARGLKSEVDSIKGVLNGFIANNTLNQYRTKYNDFVALEQEIKQEVDKLPIEITANPYYYDNVLETSYWAIKGKKTAEAQRLAYEQGQKQAQQKVKEKEIAYVESSTKVDPTPVLDVKQMSSNELFDYMRARGIVKS